MDIYNRKHNKITIGDLSFEVISYKLEHIKMVTSYFTISNNTDMYVNGLKPYTLNLKGYFPKTDEDLIALTLETLINTSTEISFTLGGLSFENLTLNRYSFNENVSNMYQEVEISFMGLSSFTEVQSNE